MAKQRCGAHLRAGASRHTGSRAFVWPRPFRFPFFHPRPEAEEEERGARGTLGLLFPSPQVSSLKPRAGSEPPPPGASFRPVGHCRRRWQIFGVGAKAFALSCSPTPALPWGLLGVERLLLLLQPIQ